MKTVGIIAEYNPFHNGHAYQLRYAREVLHADQIIVVMSGSFLQRGTPAIIDKYLRSQCALLNGADMIIELPVVYSTASAELFAAAAVSLLAATNVVDTLLFGGEWDDLTYYKKAAQILLEEPAAFKHTLQKNLTQGLSYAQARAKALSDDVPEAFMNQPNNILGVEYVKAIMKNHYAITPVCLKRQGASYHDSEAIPHENNLSATGIRNILSTSTSQDILHHELLESGIPTSARGILNAAYAQDECIFTNDCSILLHHQLLAHNDYSHYQDCTPQLSNRILNYRNQYETVEQFCQLIKTKDMAYSRISRVLCHILLDITDELYKSPESHAPYLRILGFTENGSQLLNTMKKEANTPIILQPKTAKNVLPPKALQLFEKDIHASNIRNIILTNRNHKPYPTEYTRQFTLGNISPTPSI